MNGLNARAYRSGRQRLPAVAFAIVIAITMGPAQAAATGGAVTLPSMDLPPGPIYACEIAGTRTPIEYTATVEQLCRRHPEMGPCQYAREACRKRGGRVYTSQGVEVTPAVEAVYDQKVQRVRLQ